MFLLDWPRFKAPMGRDRFRGIGTKREATSGLALLDLHTPVEIPFLLRLIPVSAEKHLHRDPSL